MSRRGRSGRCSRSSKSSTWSPLPFNRAGSRVLAVPSSQTKQTNKQKLSRSEGPSAELPPNSWTCRPSPKWPPQAPACYEKPPPGLIKEDETKPEDCIPDVPGNEHAREFLAHAPTKGLWMPLGKEVKVMQCWRCKRYGHRTGDKECPFFIKGNQKLEQFRVAHEDPMYDVIRENKRHEKEMSKSDLIFKGAGHSQLQLTSVRFLSSSENQDTAIEATAGRLFFR
ncbi:retinitis pigmentosa 9 protein isoform X3 [Malaclemys terrapin pileata]|uniref:retinitis pigmentosa 9 protein isoform X3 n=1 Tax=Malaclemys terrapin pileata TaxID=2991368 RepID=UPI0023A7C802|nr:retinitis pigmentosa 9 protein isoform X3 [Malaclemys terrapin pileata]